MQLVPLIAFSCIAHVLPSVLPPQYHALYYALRPTLMWGLTGTLLAANAPHLFCVLSLPHAAVAALAALSIGLRHPLAMSVLYGPAAVSVAAWCARFLVGSHSGAVVTAIAALQLAAMILGVVTTMVYPAPIVSNFVQVDQAREAIHKMSNFHFIRVPVLNSNSLYLDGVMVHPSIQSRFGKKKFLLYCGGNGELYEGSFTSLASLAEKLQVTVVMVNPKGVGRSDGYTRHAEDLVTDARSAVQYILTVGDGAVTARDIVAFGHSIGGGVASALVAHYYQDMSLVLDRTFSSLLDAVISLSPIGKRPRLVATVFTLTGFGAMDNVVAFNKISHSRKLVTFHRRDQIIHFADASIARLPSFAEGSRNNAFVMELVGITSDPHNVGVQELKNFDDVARRILGFYDRALNE